MDPLLIVVKFTGLLFSLMRSDRTLTRGRTGTTNYNMKDGRFADMTALLQILQSIAGVMAPGPQIEMQKGKHARDHPPPL